MPNDPAIIDEMLRNAKTIAVVGMSDKPWRASHNIGRYLAETWLSRLSRSIPRSTEVLGVPCYADLDAAQTPQHEKRQGRESISLMSFAPRKTCPPIVDDVIRLGIPYLWLQDEVIHDEAVARARAAGVKCVQNDCIYRRHAAMAR